MAIAIRQENSKTPLVRKEKKRIQKRLEKILSALRFDDAYLSVLLTSPQRMKELNKMWRGESYPARILSFPQAESGHRRKKERRGKPVCLPVEEAGMILGDLAIRVDRPGISDRMLVHGVLHLLGYEHDTEKKYAEMRAKEKEIVASIRPKPKA